MLLLLPLVGGLFLLKNELEQATTVEYRGREYTGPVRVEAGAPETAGLQPTEDVVRERQVWLPAGAAPAVPPRVLYLQRPDGGFTRYTRAMQP